MSERRKERERRMDREKMEVGRKGFREEGRKKEGE